MRVGGSTFVGAGKGPKRVFTLLQSPGSPFPLHIASALWWGCMGTGFGNVGPLIGPINRPSKKKFSSNLNQKSHSLVPLVSSEDLNLLSTHSWAQ